MTEMESRRQGWRADNRWRAKLLKIETEVCVKKIVWNIRSYNDVVDFENVRYIEK